MRGWLREKLNDLEDRGWTDELIKHKISELPPTELDYDATRKRLRLGQFLGDVVVNIFILIHLAICLVMWYAGNRPVGIYAMCTLLIYFAALPGYWSAEVENIGDDAYRVDAIPTIVVSGLIAFFLLTPLAKAIPDIVEVVILFFRYVIGIIVWTGIVILLPLGTEFCITGWWLTWTNFIKWRKDQ